MFTPLIFADIGLLILILLILAFVVTCFLLMLVGLGVLIAFPLTLIRPLFGKKVKWDKDLFIASLALTPIVIFLGILGIELLKIFGETAVEMFNVSSLFRYLCLIIVGLVVAMVVYYSVTYRLRKEINDLHAKAMIAEKNLDISRMYECQDRCIPLKKRSEVILALCVSGSALLITLFAVFMDML